MKNSVLKNEKKNAITIWSDNHTSGNKYPKKMKSLGERIACTPVSLQYQSHRAKIWNQSVFAATDTRTK